MLQFIIDGYNIVHKIKKIKDSSTPCNALTVFIYKNKLTGSRNNKVWIIFDGGRPPYVIDDFQYKVLFSGQKSADDLIIDKVRQSKNKKQIVVVSDDRQLVHKVKMLGAGILSVDKFATKKKKPKQEGGKKDIKYSLQREITEELKKIWLDNNKS